MDFDELANVYLEDSFVLGIEQKPDSVSFMIEAVLTPPDSRYCQPRQGEQHCYAKAVLTIANAFEIAWISRSEQDYRDATGNKDLGNIDSFRFLDDHYEITGDWGHLLVYSAAEPRLTFIEEP